MSNQYTESWDYTLTSNSLPYAINNGSPYTYDGKCILSADSFVNKDFAGSAYSFQGYNYNGSYSLTFDLDVSGADNHIFMVLCYGGTDYVPAIQRTVSPNVVTLGWSSYGSNIINGTGDSVRDGDFTGLSVAEIGTYRVTYIKRVVSGSYSYVGMRVVSPNGTPYKTGWAYVSDAEKHNQIGANTSGSGGSFSIGTISVIDGLTDEEADLLLTTGSMGLFPVTITPATSSALAPVTVTLAPQGTVPADYTIKYTTDGSDPSSSIGTVYSTAFVVGDPFTPGTTVTVKAAYVSTVDGTVGDIATATYTFELAAPILVNSSGYTITALTLWYEMPIHWKVVPTDPEMSIVYTVDGTDPTSSGTAITWVEGNFIPFNSHPLSLTPSQVQVNQPLKAALKYTPSGGSTTYSAVTTVPLTFVIYAVFEGWPQYPVLPIRYLEKFKDSYSAVYTHDPYMTNQFFGEYEHTVVSSIVFHYRVTVDGVSTNHTEPPLIQVPFGTGMHSLGIRISTADGSLYADAVAVDQSGTALTETQTVFSFYQESPIAEKGVYITNSTVPVTLGNPNGGASNLRYTLDGSAPTVTSTIATEAIQLPSGGVIRAIAERSGIVSTAVRVEAMSEYEITEAATALEDVNYHYHVAAQRLELTSQLAAGPETVTVGSNTTPSTASITVGGSSYQIGLWDHDTAQGAYNGFTGILWRSYPTHFWSRLAYTEATAALSWTYTESLFAGHNTVTLFEITVLSRKYSVTYAYTVTTATRATSIVRTLKNLTTGAMTSATVAGATISASVSNTLTLTIASGSISLSDGTGMSTETSTDFTAGTLWSASYTVNPSAVTLAEDQDGTASITTTAASGKFRRAPGSVVCTKSTTSATGSVAVDFQTEEAHRLVKHSMLGVPSVNPPAIVGFDKESKTTKVDGLFAMALPGTLDMTGDFVAEIKMATDFRSLMTYPSAAIATSTNLPTLSMFLVDPTTALNSTAAIDTGISIRMYVPSDRPGAYPIYLELYSPGAPPARMTLSSNSKQIVFRMTGTASGIELAAEVDGITTVLTTVSAIRTGLREVRIRRTGSTTQPRKQLTDLVKYTATGTFSKVVCSDPVLVGADFMFRGQATGFDSTVLSVPTESTRAVWFNPTTGAVTSEVIAFEPSDGRLLVGVMKSTDGNLLWTNTMYSSLVKVRTELNGSITGGTVIGVGSNLQINGRVVTWKECGYERSSTLGDLSWVQPYNHLNLREGRHFVRAKETQRIRITASAP